MKPVVLTIAGSDPSGGAGIQADLKTFHQQGIYGMSVITLLTVQNTQTVKDIFILEAEKILAQLETVLEDIPPQAVPAEDARVGQPSLPDADIDIDPQIAEGGCPGLLGLLRRCHGVLLKCINMHTL